MNPIRLTFAVAGIAIILSACNRGREQSEMKLAVALDEFKAAEETRQPVQADVPSDIALFCGDCHALPRPESFVREVWYDEIEKGFEFYAKSGRTDLKPPSLQRVLQYYRERAPAEIEFPVPPEVDASWRARFELQRVEWNDGPRVSPATACIRWIHFMPENRWRLIVTDMRDGSINEVAPMRSGSSRRLLGRVGNAARITAGDLNQDARTDLIVADLGSVNPYDHAFGQIVWLKRAAESDDFQAQVIVERLGRVADVELANFAGDSGLDLVVAEFGHRHTGSLRLLTNISGGPNEVRFSEKMLDGRPGAIRVAVNDWNSDGAMDFAAVVSQEFECVEMYVNRGDKFDRHRVSTGNDLAFGSVGIEQADIDQDGDQDILYVNGDTFDNNFANRSHGIQWLENKGDLTFLAHRLLELPGAYRAVAADIDADGDQDILAVANLPTTVYPTTLTDHSPASVVLLEQVQPQQFATRVLERGTPRYPALEVGDFDGDGKLDFAVGTQLFDTDPVGSAAAKLPRLMLWWQK